MRAAVVLVALLACNKASEETDNKPPSKLGHELAHMAHQQPRPRPAKLQQVTIKALGMYCEESCPLKVRTALAEVPTVYELGFDVSNESIFISYDAALGTPKDVTKPMIAAVKSAGFDPWLAKESWPPEATNVVQVVGR